MIIAFSYQHDVATVNEVQPTLELLERSGSVRKKRRESQKVFMRDLPPMLRDYKTEYLYLASCLFGVASGRATLDEPLIPNVARKVLEDFSTFKWSCKTSEQFTSIVQNRFVKDTSPIKRAVGDFVVKFCTSIRMDKTSRAKLLHRCLKVRKSLKTY